MALDVGAVALRLEAPGGAEVVAQLERIDKKAQALGARAVDVNVRANPATLTQATQALNALGIAAKESAGQIVVAEGELEKAASIVQRLNPALAVTAQEGKAAGAGVAQGAAQATTALEQEAVAATGAGNALAGAGQKAAQGQQTAGAAAEKMSPKVRSAANGITALAFAMTAAQPNFQSMALSAGLASSALAEAFGTAKLAAMASGIGAVVVGVTALIGLLARLAEAPPPSPILADHIKNIDTLGAATAKLEELQRKANAATAAYAAGLEKAGDAAADMESKVAAARGTQINVARLKADQEKALAELEAFTKQFQEIRSRDLSANEDATRQIIAGGAEAKLRVTQAYLDRDASFNRNAYERGQASLRDYYDERFRIIQERREAELRAVRARVAEESGPQRRGETDADFQLRLARARALASEEEAIRARATQEEQQNVVERERTERDLAARILSYERQIAEARGTTHETRMAQIAAEADAIRRLPTSETFTAEQRTALAASFETALQSAERFAEVQRRVGFELQQLAAQRQAIEAQVQAGQITEEEGSRRIAEIERNRLPALQAIAREMLAIAVVLKDPALLAAAQQLFGQLSGLGIDQAAVALGRQLEQALASNIAQAIVSGIETGAQGGIGKGFRALSASFLRGLGQMFITIGEKALAGSALIKGIVEGIAALNPVTAIAASIALIALGSAIGGSGGGGRGSAGGGFSAERALGNSLSQRISAGDLRPGSRQLAGAGNSQVSAPAAPQTFVIGLLNPGDPVAQRLINETVRNAQRRGL